VGKSRPAFKLLIAFASGIIVASQVDCPPFIPYLVTICLAIAGVLCYRLVRWQNLVVGNLFASAALAVVGFVSYQSSINYLPADHISHFVDLDRPVLLRGIVVRYPEKRQKKTYLTVDTKTITLSTRPFETDGAILVRLSRELLLLDYGDEIEVRGFLRRPRDRRNPGEFDYQGYLAAQGIFGIVSVNKESQIGRVSSGHGFWLMREVIVPVKHDLSNLISRSLPGEQAALLQGLMLGERGEISSEIKASFARLGVIHVLAVSGLHVSFVVLVLMGVLGILRVPYGLRVVLTLIGLLFYAFLTNLKPPVLRASIMAGLFLLSTLLQRKTDFVNSLSLAAFIILLLNPADLFQPGFQLSFAAVASIVYLYPRLQRSTVFKQVGLRLKKNAALRYVLDLFLVSLAAFLGTLPFTLAYFNRLPLTSLIANLMVVPLAFLALAGGIASALFSPLSRFVSGGYMAFSGLSLQAILKCAEIGEQVPFGSIEVYGFNRMHWLACTWLALLVLMWHRPVSRKRLLMLGLVLLNLWLWASNLSSSKQLEVTFLDVGQGDAAVLALPTGEHLLIDGGSKSPYFDNGRSVVAPFLLRQGIRRLDAVILSHGDSDHIGGLPYILSHFEVGEVWDNGEVKETRVYRRYLHLIDSLGVVHRILKAGDMVQQFRAVKIFVLHPTNAFLARPNHSANDASLSLKISYGKSDFLFAGDIEAAGEDNVAAFEDLARCEVLKIDHHGSRTSSTPRFLSSVAPEWAVISVGQFNRFHHPAPEVVERLKSIGAKILRTDRESAVILQTDGSQIQRIRWK